MNLGPVRLSTVRVKIINLLGVIFFHPHISFLVQILFSISFHPFRRTRPKEQHI
jgi:hypothetical protein